MKFNGRTPLIILALTIVISVTAATAPPQQNEDFKGKNLHVLPKNISHDELDQIMDSWKDALGVKCGFCHSPSKTNPKKLDFASDEKPEKDMARSMYKMTKRINQKYFNPNGASLNRVSCNTCHRGSKEPEDQTIAKK